MVRRLSLLFTVVAAILLACTGVVLAQATDKERTDKKSAASSQGESATLSHRDKDNVIPNRYIVVLKDDGSGGQVTAQGNKDPKQVANEMTQENRVEEVTDTYKNALKGFAAKIPDEKVDDVRSDPRVKYVSKDREVRASAQTLPTGVNRVDADQSSTQAGNGSGSVNVDIAIIDTGINTKHPDLNVSGGKDCSSDGKNSYADDNGHGSHVAGTAAAKDDSVGVVGVAPGARLWAVKVLNAKGSGSDSDVICGIDWVTSTKKDSDTTNDIEVANMSLSRPGEDDGNCGQTNFDAEHEAICNSVNAGVTYAVAAGNEADDASFYAPASYDEVITVSALADYNGQPGGGAKKTCNADIAKDDEMAFFSNYGSDVDLGAPGVCIKSTWKPKKGADYKVLSGTSMATPHVAGAAALYKSQHPSDTPSQVQAVLTSAANTEAVNHGHTDPFGANPEPVLLTNNY